MRECVMENELEISSRKQPGIVWTATLEFVGNTEEDHANVESE
jgi:hypothetical protein